ncbi:aldehyde dehydrogenase [Kiloniella litopenaei]|uniref:Aldehyde dehydrogenase n=1 Tax=Kiloniella litopenaei TaxID=1549748 RepID=A0A0M2R2S3_9PROT|nr:aldehyde dehydrogenase family protein [Kiloniella litopenaei]KKJ75966.1 aldehyde dehydrogenase [Kiloniella litopenaei]
MNTDFKLISPVDGSEFKCIAYLTDEDAAETIIKAQSVQGAWQATPLRDRVIICERFIDELLRKSDEIASELTWQMGRPVSFSGKELLGLEERARYMVSKAQKGLHPLEIESENSTRYIDRVPHGVCLVIAPWNYPFLTAINTIVPALLAGNTVILKPAGQTALCGERIHQALRAAGLPEGVFQSVLATHHQVAQWITQMSVNFIAFTGSVRGGKAIETTAAGKFLPVTLELGGKDPAYVRADADLDHTVASLVDGAFFNSGQSCCSIERIYVARSLFDKFVTRFKDETRKTQILGNPFKSETTLGPVVSASAADGIRKQIAEAISAGAEIVTGINEPDNSSLYLPATTLITVNHHMPVMTEETFGPVVGIMPVDSDEEAVRAMNDSQFGLSASIWSTDKTVSAELARAVQAGTVFVNRCDYLDPALAWVGVKNSGRGCSLSELGFHQVTRPKSYSIN